MRGWKISMSSSWKTPTSQTIQVSGSMPPTSELSARPMLPATATDRPPELRISPRSAVVVVFPFVPVTARIGFGRSRAPSSSPSQMGRPRVRAPATKGASPRTPGLFTTRSIPCSSVSSSPPRWTSTPSARSLPASSASFQSKPTTVAPTCRRACAAAVPARARPTTSTRLPARSLLISGESELEEVAVEEREAGRAEDRADDPEPHHDLRLRPRLHLEVVVDRHDQEHAPARSLEADDLDDPREHLDHEDARDQRQQDLRTRNDRESGDRTAEGERPRVAHVQLARKGVVPEEPDRPADQRGRKRRNVEKRVAARPRIPRAEPRDARDRKERQENDHNDAGGQPVDPIREVRAVGRSGDDQEEQGVIAPREVECPAGDRDVEVRREARALVE